MTQHIIDTDELEKLPRYAPNVFGVMTNIDIDESSLLWVRIDDLLALIANSPQVDGMVSKPQKEGIYVWRNASAVSLVYVSKRPSSVEVGGTLNAQVIDSSKFYDGCAIDKWLGGHWIEVTETPMLSAYKPQAVLSGQGLVIEMPQVDDVLEQAAQAIDSLASSGENKDDWTITRDLAFHRASEAVRTLIVKPQSECKINPFYSRMCELGTKACVVEHKPQSDDVRKDAWISVEDRLPECNVMVLIHDESLAKRDRIFNEKEFVKRSAGVRIGVMYHIDEGLRSEGSNGRCDVTHWQPLPAPPLDKARE